MELEKFKHHDHFKDEGKGAMLIVKWLCLR